MTKNIYQHISMRSFDKDFEAHEQAGSCLEFLIHGAELEDWKTNGIKDRLLRIQNSYNPHMCFHGPIYAYDPATKDKYLREMTWRRCMNLLEITSMFKTETIVLHSTYIHQVRRFSVDKWIDGTVEFYNKLLKELPNNKIRIALENIFEIEPEPLAEVINRINHPQFGHCFDIGHFNMFQKNYQADTWLEHFKNKLYHLHIHDNHGEADLHLPPGLGSINFAPLIKVVKSNPEPMSLTVEGKTFEHNEIAVKYVKKHFPGF